MPSPSCAGVVVSRRRRDGLLWRACVRGGGAAAFVARVARRSFARQYVRTSVFVCGQLASRGGRSGAAAKLARAADRPRGTRPRGGVLSRVFCIQTEHGIATEVYKRACDFTLSLYHFYSPNCLKGIDLYNPVSAK